MKKMSIFQLLRYKIPWRYRCFVPGAFKYEDEFIICVKFRPVSLFKLRKMDYFWEYRCFTDDESPYPTELDNAEEFFDRITVDVFKEYDFGCFCGGGGEWSYQPVQDADFKRNYVYDKSFRIVLALDRRFTLNPFCKTDKEDVEPRCIYANGKKYRSYGELELKIRQWLEKLRKETAEDALKCPKHR